MNFKITRSGWIILALIIINLATLATVWLRPGSARPPHVPLRVLWKQELGLDENQAAQFHIEVQRHRKAMQSLFGKMRSNRGSMLHALSLPASDTIQARAFADSSAAIQRQIDLQFLEHYLALRAVCTPGQVKKLNHVFAETIQQGPGHPPGPPPHGAPGHPPPGH